MNGTYIVVLCGEEGGPLSIAGGEQRASL